MFLFSVRVEKKPRAAETGVFFSCFSSKYAYMFSIIDGSNAI